MNGFSYYDVLEACQTIDGRRALPAFCKALDNLSSQTNARVSLARISRIQPGVVIALHAGLHNSRWRLHMGLQLPSTHHALLRVGGTPITWELGKAFVFDDSYEHEVTWEPPVEAVDYSAAEARLVLIVDFQHPDLAPPHEPICPTAEEREGLARGLR